MLWIADIEANGLDDATQIHCIVLKQYKGVSGLNFTVIP